MKENNNYLEYSIALSIDRNRFYINLIRINGVIIKIIDYLCDMDSNFKIRYLRFILNLKIILNDKLYTMLALI